MSVIKLHAASATYGQALGPASVRSDDQKNFGQSARVPCLRGGV